VCFLAENIVAQNSTQDSLQLAHRLYASEVHQARMLATLIFGKLAALSPEAFSFLKDGDHKYVRKSVGNALRDVSRFHKDLVRAELATWDTSNKNIAYTYHLASKFLQKERS